MLEEAPVLGGQNRLDDVVRQLVDRHGIALDDTALADLVTVAVEEGDGVVALAAPVLRRFLEGRHGEREHDDRADRSQREAFTRELDQPPPPSRYAEAAEEDGDVLPAFACLEACFVEGGIDPRIHREQSRGPGSLWFPL